MVFIGVWSREIKAGEPLEVLPEADIRITNVALTDELEDASGRTTVKLNYATPEPGSDDEESDEDDNEDAGPVKVISTTLTSLTPGKIESSTIDLYLMEGEEYLFETVGKNTVHLTGNYIQQPTPSEGGFDEFDSDSENEDAYDLRNVSSDVEVEADGMESDASRFEEVADQPEAKSLKRARESDAATGEGAEKLSKAEKKKKRKAENGAAVAVEATTTTVEVEKKKDAKKDDKKSKKEGETKAETKELSGGLKITDSKVGTGPAAKKGQTIQMRYIGKLQNGKVFDKNVKGTPFKFRLGAGEVIKGWDEGIAGMQAGGERVLVIPPALAYGKKGVSGIPPNATLTFEVKLVSIR